MTFLQDVMMRQNVHMYVFIIYINQQTHPGILPTLFANDNTTATVCLVIVLNTRRRIAYTMVMVMVCVSVCACK